MEVFDNTERSIIQFIFTRLKHVSMEWRYLTINCNIYNIWC